MITGTGACDCIKYITAGSIACVTGATVAVAAAAAAAAGGNTTMQGFHCTAVVSATTTIDTTILY